MPLTGREAGHQKSFVQHPAMQDQQRQRRIGSVEFSKFVENRGDWITRKKLVFAMSGSNACSRQVSDSPGRATVPCFLGLPVPSNSGMNGKCYNLEKAADGQGMATVLVVLEGRFTSCF